MKRLIYDCQAEMMNPLKKITNGIENSLETIPRRIKLEMKQAMKIKESILIKEKKDEERTKSIIASEIMNMGTASSNEKA
jgi:hypothetical protein